VGCRDGCQLFFGHKYNESNSSVRFISGNLGRNGYIGDFIKFFYSNVQHFQSELFIKSVHE